MRLETFCKVAAAVANSPMYKQAGDDDPLKYTKRMAVGGAAGGGVVPLLASLLAMKGLGIKPGASELGLTGILTGAGALGGAGIGAAAGGTTDLVRHLVNS